MKDISLDERLTEVIGGINPDDDPIGGLPDDYDGSPSAQGSGSSSGSDSGLGQNSFPDQHASY